jgi:cytochrome c oxidase assembly protein subunit 15
MQTNKWVQWWMLLGLVMLVVQVMVGGITRLTGSGLSITEWDIVTGSIPPTSEEQWIAEFELYKETPQYREINEGMEMGSIFESGTFKFIYFWEWIHRFWARIMGLVFLIPLIFFLVKKWIKPPLLKRLGVVFLLAGLAASFGWIMVASGLVERPWVNAYKLALHLCIAFSVYSYLWWTYLKTKYNGSGFYPIVYTEIPLRKLGYIFTGLLWVQIFLGGVMAGMKAGVVYPSWPDMNGEIIPQIVFNISEWNVNNFNNYDQNEFMPALIHILHRGIAYILTAFGLYYFVKIRKNINFSRYQVSGYMLIILLIIQVVLGIFTVINCQGSIPLFYGVAHQITALFLLTAALHLNYIWRHLLQKRSV